MSALPNQLCTTKSIKELQNENETLLKRNIELRFTLQKLKAQEEEDQIVYLQLVSDVNSVEREAKEMAPALVRQSKITATLDKLGVYRQHVIYNHEWEDLIVKQRHDYSEYLDFLCQYLTEKYDAMHHKIGALCDTINLNQELRQEIDQWCRSVQQMPFFACGHLRQYMANQRLYPVKPSQVRKNDIDVDNH